MKTTLAILAFSAGVYLAEDVLYIWHGVLPWTECRTDTECMKHCPPPNDDPDCDGGPQDAPALATSWRI